MTEPAPRLDFELARISSHLNRLGVRFALVGGIAISIRGEVRLTRDIDLAVAVSSDAEVESLARELHGAGYTVAAIVEHEERDRLATARLQSAPGIRIDLLAASSGIEQEIVAAAEPVPIEGVGTIPVAVAEDLLAMKILAATARRPQDRIDARALLLASPDLDLALVRDRLRLITTRGFHRDQDLEAKLREVVDDGDGDGSLA